MRLLPLALGGGGEEGEKGGEESEGDLCLFHIVGVLRVKAKGNRQ